MKTKNSFCAIVFGITLTASWGVNAADCSVDSCVTYTLTDVKFNDGGTASGSFTYDPSSDFGNDDLSAVNITTTSGTEFAGSSYVIGDTYYADPGLFEIVSSSGSTLVFNFGLSSGFGSIGAGGEYGGGADRMTISGEVVSAAAPEIDANTAAASLTLLLGTLVAMVARRRPNASGRETA